ncbi:hypothetical protein FOZ63_027806, partial [Perkinsus olseni]
MVVFASRTWRNLTAKVVGVKSIPFDPLEKQRAAVLEHAAKAEALYKQLVRLSNLTDEIRSAQLEITKQSREVIAPPAKDEEASTLCSTADSGAGVEYTQAICLFADQLSRCEQSLQALRPQLQVAVGEAQKLVQRNADLQQKLKDRDRAYADLDHYNHKIEDLKTDASKRSKKDVKGEERLARNVAKHRMAEVHFIQLDEQVRVEMSQLLEGTEADFAKIIAQYSRYLGVSAFAGMQGITAFTDQVPSMVRQQVERDEDPFPFHNQNSGASIIEQSMLGLASVLAMGILYSNGTLPLSLCCFSIAKCFYITVQYQCMVVFASKTWRNLTDKVIGVKAISSDPLEKQRAALLDHAAKAQARPIE